jgi:hypothetical protein
MLLESLLGMNKFKIGDKVIVLYKESKRWPGTLEYFKTKILKVKKEATIYNLDLLDNRAYITYNKLPKIMHNNILYNIFGLWVGIDVLILAKDMNKSKLPVWF